jgi:hypothetical protein
MYCFHSPVVNTQKTKKAKAISQVRPTVIVHIDRLVETQEGKGAVYLEAGDQQHEDQEPSAASARIVRSGYTGTC